MSIKEVFEDYYDGEKNFMTPNVVKYGHKAFNGELLLAEFSWGTGISGNYIFGVSCLVYNPKTCETQKIDLSKPFSTSKEGYDYFKSISAEEFKKAYRYGDIKLITM